MRSRKITVRFTRKKPNRLPPSETLLPPLRPVTLMPQAGDRLRTAYLSTSVENPTQADPWLSTARQKILALGQDAESHPIARESKLFRHEIREMVLEEISMRILFRIEKASIQVLDVQPHFG